MNKYLEALNRLAEETIPNPYTLNHNDEDIAILQELVDKEIPMKVKYLSNDFLSDPYNVECPSCKYILGKDFIPNNKREESYHQYCCRCGQKLDWSDECEI